MRACLAASVSTLGLLLIPLPGVASDVKTLSVEGDQAGESGTAAPWGRTKRSIRDALRAILAAGLNITTRSELMPVLEVADAGTGTTVLADLYADMGAAPKPAELESLWRELGVALEGGKIVFDDLAPLAPVRKAITATDKAAFAWSIGAESAHAKIASR